MLQIRAQTIGNLMLDCCTDDSARQWLKDQSEERDGTVFLRYVFNYELPAVSSLDTDRQGNFWLELIQGPRTCACTLLAVVQCTSTPSRLIIVPACFVCALCASP